MSSFFGFLRSRFFWVTIGVIALCVLIWMFGDLLAFGELRPLEPAWARICLIGLIFVYCLVRLLLARWRAGRMNERIANMLRTSLAAEAAADKGQTAILKDRFSEALSMLRKARFESGPSTFWDRIVRRGRYVYELPWYVIIGAPGVGKTTALLNSGLSFPLSGQIGAAAIRGTGGTRNCDWWFTNEAVFIDTAGRYTTHETDVQTDKAEWRGFLSLLKKNRTRQPINGVLVMLSVAELLGQKREDYQKHAATLRQRLDELRSDLGMSFPIYLLINKCDLLLGFDEYFSTLDRSGRAQVWGTTLSLHPSGKYQFDLGQLASECDLLQARINAGLIDVLQAEPDLARRELIYAFPQQFGALTEAIKGMLSDLLEPSRFSESPLLRGIYFTSATQEGTPFDRVVHVLEQSFPVQRPPKQAVAGEGKAYFLHELLSKVVFGEAHIAGRDLRAERRSYAWHTGGYVFSVLALAGATLAWATSRHNNQSYLDAVDVKVENMKEVLPRLPRESGTDIGALLEVLNSAESLLDTDDVNVDHPPLKVRLGLFQGSSLKVKVRGEKGLYKELLRKRLAPAIESNLKRELRHAVDTNNMESRSAYEGLKAYLMMHESDRLNEKAFAEAVNFSWRGSLIDKESEESLKRHVRALVTMAALAPSEPKDEQLITKARGQLNAQTPARRVLNQIKNSPEFDALPKFSMRNALDGREWPLIDKRGDAGEHSYLFTREGFERYVRERDGALELIGKDEAWVLGKPLPANLKREVDVLYVNEYIAEWERCLNNVGIVRPRTLSEAADIADRLSRENSPLLLFLQRVVQETELVKESDKPDGALTASVGSRIKQKVDNIAGFSGTGEAAGKLLAQGQGDDPALEVNRRFASLRKFVNGAGGDGVNAPILQEMKEFNKVKELLDRAVYAKEARQPMPDTSSLTSLVNLPPGRLPEPFGSAVKAIAGASKEAITTAKNTQETSSLKDEVTEFCKKAIAGRYPFDSNATASVTEGAFSDMFGPGGRMERFRQQQGPGAVLPSEFGTARNIKDAFFRNGDRPVISFAIKPIVMDGSITNLTLNIGGQQIRYRHDSPVSTSVSWPASDNQVRLSLLPPIDSGVNDASESGLWALHRLFDKYGQIRRGTSPDVFEVVLNVGGRRATFEIRPTSTPSPFDMSELRKFRCPQIMPKG